MLLAIPMHVLVFDALLTRVVVLQLYAVCHAYEFFSDLRRPCDCEVINNALCINSLHGGEFAFLDIDELWSIL